MSFAHWVFVLRAEVQNINAGLFDGTDKFVCRCDIIDGEVGSLHDLA